MELKLNSLNLNTGWYKTEGIQFDSSPPIEFTDLSFASADGAKFVTSKFTPKTLTITGRITHNTVAGLEAEMDNFKKVLLSTPNINLNFSYANSYRQYVGNVQNLTLTRKHFNITYVPFEITFVAEDPPFAYDISSIDQVTPNLSEVFSSDAVIGNTYSHTLTMSGTAPPLARWTYLLDAISGRTEQLVFKSITTGKQLELNAALSAGDQVVIDEESLEVKLNNIGYNYEGVFPSFDIGGNEFEWQVYGIGNTTSGGLYKDQSQEIGGDWYAATNTYPWFAQTFTPGMSTMIGKISVSISRPVNTTGTVRAYVYNTSSGVPSTLLATANETFDISVLKSNYASWIDFTFPSGVNLISGTQYAIVIYFSLGSGYASVRHTSRDLYTAGELCYRRVDQSSWSIRQDRDLQFRTYMSYETSSSFNHTSSLKIEQKKRFL